MRVLVSGGAGFIGSHLVDRLISDGHRVTVVDDMSRGRRENLHYALGSSQCELIEASLTHPALINIVASSEPVVVYHLAAQIDVRVSVANPVLDATTNVLGTVALLEASRRAGVHKVVFASSVAIYGPPQSLPVTEQAPVRPLSPYATSKLTGEQYLRQFQDLHGLAATTLVLSNTYGPRQDPHGEAGVVAIFADAMLTGRETKVFGDGRNTRDYVYVDDVVDAFVRASGPETAGLRLNIATGTPTSDMQLNRMVAEAVGGANPPFYAAARLGDIPHMVVDPTAARQALGWQPRVSLEAGLAATVESIRNPG